MLALLGCVLKGNRDIRVPLQFLGGPSAFPEFGAYTVSLRVTHKAGKAQSLHLTFSTKLWGPSVGSHPLYPKPRARRAKAGQPQESA